MTTERHEMPEREFRHLERTLGKLDDCVELSDEKKQFIDDLCQRVIRDGRHVRFTIKETATLARMRERHL